MTAMQWQHDGVATTMQLQCDGDERRNSNGNKWSNGNTTALTAMVGAMVVVVVVAIDSTTATAMEGVTATRRQ
jgi:hypothetical protein